MGSCCSGVWHNNLISLAIGFPMMDLLAGWKQVFVSNGCESYYESSSPSFDEQVHIASDEVPA